MSHITVPTPETAAVSHWMLKLISTQKPVMLIGLAGCGKTQLVNGMLKSLNISALMLTVAVLKKVSNSTIKLRLRS